MAIDNVNNLREDYEYVTSTKYLNLHAIIHARSIHRFRNTPEDLRPRISERSVKEGSDLAHNLIVDALKYLSECDADDQTDTVLRAAAQNLEKLYIDELPDYPNRTQELHTAALAYYLAGYYARAYVIIRGVTDSDERYDNLMGLMFLRELTKCRGITLSILNQKNYIDTFLAESVQQGDLSQPEAINCSLEGTINRIYALLYEFARTGREKLIIQALDLSQIGSQLAIDQKSSDWWWIFHCTIALLREYHRNSLWTCLQSMVEEDSTNLVRRYIRSAFFRHPLPILELWRSQSHVIENIGDGKSYCLKMPTSSGKTRIAELAILKFLLDNQNAPEKKCLYIAPYRALAVEIEQSLSRSFRSIGIGVSQLYGSYDLNPAESLLVEESKILIATPEKMDAFLRYNDDVAQQVGLIIVDEGHIIDEGERGLRYELYLHRLVRRYERNGVRTLFISAVMPNVEQFSLWITGRDSNEGVLESNWRASQLLLGILSWNGESGRVDYIYRDQESVDQSFFITNYLHKFDPNELKIAKCGRRRFPLKNAPKKDLVAMAAIKATGEGATLVFTPQKNNVQHIAEAIIELLQLQEKIDTHFQRPLFRLPVNLDNTEKAEKLARCLRFAKETTGDDSIVVRALECGFVVHCGDIPRSLRIHLEELIREGILQLVVANTTLAQGVNLPVKTILIHSLYNKGKKINARDFWNLCGRAGRALYETEGHVYLIVEAENYKDAYDDLEEFVEQIKSDNIISSIRLLLQNLVRAWQERFPQIGHRDIANLCQLLTDNDILWLDDKMELQAKLRILDSQLLALIEEQNLDITDPNQELDLTSLITDLFKDSMLYIQVNSVIEPLISSVEVISLIVQRVQRISLVCKTKQRLHCYYKMAISIDDCTLIESLKADLMSYLLKAEGYMSWTTKEQAKYIVQLCVDFLMKLKDVSDTNENDELSECWSQILTQWLMGKTASEITTNIDLPDDWKNAMKISTLIDDLCDFRLPWGLNAVSMFWQESVSLAEISEDALFNPPEVVSFFPSMLRFGVHDPVATVALAMGLDSRQAALILSEYYEGPIDALSILAWLRLLDEDDVRSYTDDALLQKILADFIGYLRQRNSFDLQALQHLVRIKLQSGSQKNILIEEGDTLVSKVEDKQVHLYTQSIDYLGCAMIENDNILRHFQNERTTITIQEITQSHDGVYLDLSLI